MKYHKHLFIKRFEGGSEGCGKYYDIYNDKGEFITNALTLNNAKEFVDTYNKETKSYNYNVLG